MESTQPLHYYAYAIDLQRHQQDVQSHDRALNKHGEIDSKIKDIRSDCLFTIR